MAESTIKFTVCPDRGPLAVYILGCVTVNSGGLQYNLMVGIRIREVRESMHLTREKFSEKCDISTSFLADIERGNKSLTAKTIFKICAACNISADYIIFGHKSGFDRDIVLEILNSYTDDQLEHISNILYEINQIR